MKTLFGTVFFFVSMTNMAFADNFYDIILNLSDNLFVSQDQVHKSIFFLGNKLEGILQQYHKYHIDYQSDDSIFKYVDKHTALNNTGYIPDDLINMKNKRTYDQPVLIRQDIAQNLYNMLIAMENDGLPIRIRSGYRSYDDQQTLYKKYTSSDPDQETAAKPGHSEHQLGLAIDFKSGGPKGYFKNSSEYLWLSANAHKYGFIQSYKHEYSSSGYIIEPWHWRYVGIDLATFLRKNDLEFGEYIYKYYEQD